MINKTKNRAAAGFSLIELLIVLVILGMLGGLVGPRLFTQVDASKVDVAETQVRMLKTAIQAYRLDNGMYPDDNTGLQALVRRPPEIETWNGPYLEEILPSDPWGNDFVYQSRASNFQGFALYSYGADGEEGGEGLNADIGFLP